MTQRRLWGMASGGIVLVGAGWFGVWKLSIAPTATAAPLPINLNTYVPTDLAAKPVARVKRTQGGHLTNQRDYVGHDLY